MQNELQWQKTFEAIGTKWVIDIYNPDSKTSQEEVFESVLQRIAEYDKNYSRFRTNSFVSLLAQSPGTYALPDDAEPLLDTYYKAYKVTDGAVTPLIGEVMVQSGYDRDYSLQPKKLTKPPTWQQAISYNYPTITLKAPVLLDFGAAGKGYLIDIVGGVLDSFGIHSYCIDAGGDIVQKSEKNLTLDVALENPNNITEAIGIAHITNQSICASSGNRRRWKDFHHIINPHTLKSTETIIATWAVAPTALVADAVATCLFFAEPNRILTQFDFEYVIVFADHSVQKSNNFPGELFLRKQYD